jgi:phosphoglycerol transferase MdoB-like AlkP superfamily enzyme
MHEPVMTAESPLSRLPLLPRWIERADSLRSLFVVQLGIWSILRLVLFVAFADRPLSAAEAVTAVIAGAFFDLLVAITCSLPLLLILSAFRSRWLTRTWARVLILGPACFLLVFDAFLQFFFFEEYRARYNHLALDYLMYPDEVLGNIFASYNVPLFVGLAILIALGLTWWAARRSVASVAWSTWSWRDRVLGLGLTSGLAVCLWFAWSIAPTSIIDRRTSNEVALNGWSELIRAFLTSHLDYKAYYVTVPTASAAPRFARMVGPRAADGGLIRHFEPAGTSAGRRMDIVIVLEESLGSSFSARFGGQVEKPVTPELDRWSQRGLALTNVIANGNRTIRGMEGILCSFLPLPGDSIVKRNRSENVATVARILGAQGYQTTFFMGGRGLFDSVRPFMTANGYQRFVEQSDYPADDFRTIWGVADEFVFDAMIRAQKEANRLGTPWFATALTVSNHKPFDIPPGRVNWPADGGKREGAVLYADWALGRYLATAEREGLLDHTVILIVGDHGARVYGAEEIPVTSYRVPAVFLTPDSRYQGRTIDRLVSQIDLTPTLLSLAGIRYEAPFFGQDVLGLPDEGGRAFVNHNRSIGLLTDRSLVVLGLNRSVTFYTRSNRASDHFTRAVENAESHELALDAASAFQTAYEAYEERRFTVSP